MKKSAVLLFMLAFLLAVPGLALADDGARGRFVIGQDFRLKAGEALYDDLVVIGGTATLEEGSSVRGTVVVVGGNAMIAGTVTGDLTVIGGTLQLESSAVIGGQAIAIGGTLEVNSQAQVKGGVVQGFALPWKGWQQQMQVRAERSWPLMVIRGIFRTIFALLAAITLGAVAVLLLPEQTERVATVIWAQPLLSLGAGLLTVVVLPILLVLLTVLIVTCIAVPFLLLAFIVAGTFGWLAFGLLLGKRILEALGVEEGSPLVAVLIGVSIITLLAQVPCLGWLLVVLIGSLGLGAVILTRFGTTPYPWPTDSSSSSSSASVAPDMGKDAE